MKFMVTKRRLINKLVLTVLNLDDIVRKIECNERQFCYRALKTLTITIYLLRVNTHNVVGSQVIHPKSPFNKGFFNVVSPFFPSFRLYKHKLKNTLISSAAFNFSLMLILLFIHDLVSTSLNIYFLLSSSSIVSISTSAFTLKLFPWEPSQFTWRSCVLLARNQKQENTDTALKQVETAGS